MRSNCLVILSNNKYVDLWDGLFSTYNNYPFLSDNFDIFITTDDFDLSVTPFIPDGVQILKYPNDVSWFFALKFVVKEYLLHKYHYCLFTFDDLCITELRADRISDVLKRDFKYYKLLSTHYNIYSKCYWSGDNISLENSNDSYIGSLVFTIFELEFIVGVFDLMPENLNPWQYELVVSNYLNDKGAFFCSRENLVNYQNLVVKGKYNPVAKHVVESILSRRLNLVRERMSVADIFKYYFKLYVWILFRFTIPYAFQRQLRVKNR